MKKNIKSIEEMQRFADQLIPHLKKDTYLLLSGTLGAGKTTLTKMILKKLGVTEVVSSPTFVILNQYQTPNLLINHMDAYRLQKSDEVEEFLEQFSGALNIIEWYDNLNVNFKSLNCIYVDIKLNDEERIITVEGIDENE